MNYRLFSILNCFLFVANICFANNLNSVESHFDTNEINSHVIIQGNSADNEPIQYSIKHIKNANSSDVAQLVSEIENVSDKNLVVSTNNLNVLKDIFTKPALFNHFKTKVLPYGEALKKSYQEVVVDKVKAGAKYIVDSAKNDKIGIAIVTVTTAYDSFLWIHAESLSVEQKTLQVILNIILAGTFSINKDMWSKTTRPLENKISSFLNKYGRFNIQKNVKSAGALSSKFLASLTIGLGIQTMKMSIISMDQMYSSLSSVHFWGSTLSLAALLTASSFTWSELISDIDLKKNPLAKFTVQRMIELRSILLGTFASSAVLLQPGVYGYTSWVVIVSSAAVGFMAYLNTNRITNWIEGLYIVRKIYPNYKIADQYLDEKLFSPSIKKMVCHKLFK